MTLAEAAEQGITKLRNPVWITDAYMEIIIVEVSGHRCHGLWGQLFDRETQKAIGAPTPQPVLLDGIDMDMWEPVDAVVEEKE